MTSKKKAAGKTPAATSRKKAADKPVVKPVENSEPSSHQDPVPEREPHSLCVVIPFRADKSKGNELQYAVRAWDRNFPFVKIVVIGDSLPWFGPEIVHIPFEDFDENPQINTTAKIMAAIASDEVDDMFALSCDDIYPVTPILLADLGILRVNGKLKDRNTRGGHFEKNLERTITKLTKDGFMDPWDYDIHAPYLYDKSSLADVIMHYGADKEGMLLPSLYFNSLFSVHVPIKVNARSGSYIGRVHREDPTKAILEKAFYNRKFINNDNRGWASVEPFLKKLFPDKCRFEK